MVMKSILSFTNVKINMELSFFFKKLLKGQQGAPIKRVIIEFSVTERSLNGVGQVVSKIWHRQLNCGSAYQNSLT